MEKNNHTLILFIFALITGIIGRLFFPVLLFVSLAPLISLTQTEHSLKTRSLDLLTVLALVIPVMLYAQFNGYALADGLIYSLSISLGFIAYDFVNKNLSSTIGSFLLLLFFLAFEYIALILSPNTADFILGGSLNSGLAPWSAFSGLLGVSGWIVTGNILTYYIFLAGKNTIFSGKVRWLSLIYSVLIMVVPVIIPFLFDVDFDPITPEVVKNFYNGRTINSNVYALRGEFIGRTATWVSTLILVYAFVKRRIND